MCGKEDFRKENKDIKSILQNTNISSTVLEFWSNCLTLFSLFSVRAPKYICDYLHIFP